MRLAPWSVVTGLWLVSCGGGEPESPTPGGGGGGEGDADADTDADSEPQPEPETAATGETGPRDTDSDTDTDCDTDSDTDSDTDADGDPTPDTWYDVTDTGGGPVLNVSGMRLTFDLLMGVNCAQETAPVYDPATGDAIPSTFNVYLGDPNWTLDLAQTGLYCTTTYFIDGAPNAPWVAGAGGWFGIDVDPAVGWASDCAGPVQNFLGPSWGYTWGFALAPLDQQIAQWLQSQGANPADFTGGLLQSNLFAGPYDDAIFAQAYEVDSSMTLVVGGNGYLTVIPGASVPQAWGVSAGWYYLRSFYYWTFN